MAGVEGAERIERPTSVDRTQVVTWPLDANELALAASWLVDCIWVYAGRACGAQPDPTGLQGR